MKMNIGRGSLRLWVVLSVAWVVSVAFVQWNEVEYAYRYSLHYKQLASEHEEFRARRLEELRQEEATLVAEERVRLAKQQQEAESEFGKRLKAAGIAPQQIEPDGQLEKVRALALSYSKPATPEPPRYGLLALLVAPPLAVALLGLLLWQVAGWVVRGFRARA